MIFNNIFSENDLNYINNLTEVIDAKNKLKTNNDKVSFNITLTDSIKNSLSLLGLDLTNVTTIPMRWIIGDTHEHIDSGKSKFTNTYLVFMNNSSGTFLIETTPYPITQNTAYVFNEGLAHSTQNTQDARLLLGPMNEYAEPVGGVAEGIYYYLTEEDVTNGIIFAIGTSYTLGSSITYGSLSGYPGVGNGWQIVFGINAPEYDGSSTGIHPTGDTLNDDASSGITAYFVYIAPLSPPCFNTGTQILCLNEKFEEVYVPVENLKSGNIVKTYIEGYRRIHLIGKGTLINNSSELHCMYKLSKINSYVNNSNNMIDDLIVTGDHTIMIDKAYADGERVKMMYDKVLVVAKESPKFTKLMDTQPYTYYHFSLENDGFVDRTFVVYANGALSETTSEAQFSENKLTLIE